MNRNVAKLSMAALAGASCLLSSHVAKAAITIVATRAASGVVFANGTYDVIVFDLTALTGTDAATGSNAGHTQDAEILGLQGTFTVTGGTGTTEMAAIGNGAAKQEPNFLSSASSATGGYAGPGSTHSSYVAFPNDASAVTVTEVGTGTKTTGNASSFGDTWSVTPSTGNGNVGGVEPGKDPQSLTVTDSGNDPYANNGLLAEILVNPGASVSFTGAYIDYGYPTGNSTTFSYSPSGGGPTTGAQKVISLLTTASQGTAPAGYGANPIATLAVSPNGKSTSVSLGGTGATSGYVAVTGGPAPYYALSLDVNGVAATASALQQIVGDINNNSTGVTATYLASGGAFGLGFAPGILLSDSVAGGSQYFSFDFSSSGSDLSLGDTTLGPVSVVAIAAVPEPATAAGIIIGASGLLLGRRRTKGQSA